MHDFKAMMKLEKLENDNANDARGTDYVQSFSIEQIFIRANQTLLRVNLYIYNFFNKIKIIIGKFD